MKKSNPTHLEQQSGFTEPEVEAALQLIQLSGESDAYLHGHGLSNSSAGDGLATSMKRKNKEGVGDHEESQGSSTSDITSAPRRFFGPRFEAEGDDEGCNVSDVAGSRRRKRKKFRSVVEIYKISR